jgi:hypothetical protein
MRCCGQRRRRRRRMRMMMMMGGLERCFAVWDSPNRFRAAAAEEAEEEGMGGAEGGGGGTGQAISAGKLPHSITEILKNCGMCLALVAAIAMPLSPFSAAVAAALENRGPAVADLSVLISGPPIKDANALLRNALPITNKPIKDVQKSLEDITEDLKQPGEKALGYVERVRSFFFSFFYTVLSCLLACLLPLSREEEKGEICTRLQ